MSGRKMKKMAPPPILENEPLLSTRKAIDAVKDDEETGAIGHVARFAKRRLSLFLVLCACIFAFAIAAFSPRRAHRKPGFEQATGPYKLVELQEGESFFDHYSFYVGADSIGSAGFNEYISKDRAEEIGILNITTEETTTEDGNSARDSFVYMSSKPTNDGPRESIRLEGKQFYDYGLFIIDLRHVPAGCGVWPAFWLTNEEGWPKKGEIDIVEGINLQSAAKTALHTTNECTMYAHVPQWKKTGTWDYATGIPNSFSGEPDFKTWKEADDCWVLAAHQWANQGCVAVSRDEGTLGIPFNKGGGGVYALEWDPANRHIRSWAFAPHNTVPTNLLEAIQTASKGSDRVMPDTSLWGLPYGYFAIGKDTGCRADHFQDMRLVINLAFCGSVSGNRFFGDCPNESQNFNVDNNAVLSCNSWIESNPKELEEAYWKIKGVYVYQREIEQA